MNFPFEKIKEELNEAQAVVLGAGSGLSAAAGYEYRGDRFRKYFKDYEVKYNFHDMYSGGFYPYDTLEEYWAYWSVYVYINRFLPPPMPVYERLLELLKEKDYFVLTTNVDHCFQRAGFAKDRLFYTQGDYGLFQCSVPCHGKTYENEQIIRRMVAEQKDMKVPTELIPRCPRCGKPMRMNLREDSTFVEDDGWRAAYDRYKKFLAKNKGKRILFLELGVGMNTPGIIKYPFWRMTAEFKNAFYVCLNKDEAYLPSALKDKGVAVSTDIREAIDALAGKQ